MSATIDVLVGKRIAGLREVAQLSAGDLAFRVNADLDRIFRIEAGLERPAAALLARLAHLFGIPIWSFFEPGNSHLPADINRPAQRPTLH